MHRPCCEILSKETARSLIETVLMMNQQNKIYTTTDNSINTVQYFIIIVIHKAAYLQVRFI